MKIFGKEININGKHRIVAISLAAVMVVALGTIMFASWGPVTVYAKKIIIEQIDDRIAAMFTTKVDFDAFDGEAAVDVFGGGLGEGTDFTFGTNESVSAKLESGKVVLTPKDGLGVFKTSKPVLYFAVYDSVLTLKITGQTDSGESKVLYNGEVTATPSDDAPVDKLSYTLPLTSTTYKNYTTITLRFSVTRDLTVNVASDSDIGLEGISEGVNKVDADVDTKFTVNVARGYEVVSSNKSVNIVEVASQNTATNTRWQYKVTVPGAAVNDTVVLSRKAVTKTVTVTEPDRKDYIFLTDAAKTELGYSVNYGSSFEFTIVPNDGVEYPEVTCNDNTVTHVNGTYIIPNITEDTTITISESSKKKVAVSWTNPVGATFEVKNGEIGIRNGDTVDYGSKLTITLKAADGYDVKDATVLANGGRVNTKFAEGAVTASEYEYEVKNTTAFTATNVVEKMVTVTFSGYDNKTEFTTNITAPSISTRYNGSINFTVAANAGYNMPEVTPSDNKKATLVNVGGTYTISNITDNVTVTFTKKGKLSYPISINNVEGLEISIEGKTGPSMTANYNEPITIKVVVESGRDWNGSLLINGAYATAKKCADNTWTYSYDVTGPTTVSAMGTTIQNHTVTIIADPSITAPTQVVVPHGQPATVRFTLSNGMTDDKLNWQLESEKTSLAYAVIDGLHHSITPAIEGQPYTFTTSVITSDDTLYITGTEKVDVYLCDCCSAAGKNTITSKMISGSTATLTITPKPGYVINGVTALDNNIVAPAEMMFIAEEKLADDASAAVTAKNADGSVNVTVSLGHDDVWLKVDEVPITVNVTYKAPNVTTGSYTSPTGSDVIVSGLSVDNPNAATPSTYSWNDVPAYADPYFVDPSFNPAWYEDPMAMYSNAVPYGMATIAAGIDGQTSLVAMSNGDIIITLDPKGFANGLYENAQYATYNKVVTTNIGTYNPANNTVTITANDRRNSTTVNLELYATYTLATPGDNKLPFIDVQVTGEGATVSSGKAIFSWLATINYGSLAGDGVGSYGFKLESYGFAVYKPKYQTLTAETVKAQVANLSANTVVGAGGTAVQYTYYTGNTLPNGNSFRFNSPANILAMSTDTGDYSRAGYFWFKATINGQPYIGVYAAPTITYQPQQ